MSETQKFQGELKSEVMYKDDKKYHMDLKENARGRFLKVSETFTRGYSRFQVKKITKVRLLSQKEMYIYVLLY